MTDEFDQNGPGDAPPDAQPDPSFLRRWSRRKSQAQARESDATVARAQATDAAADGEPDAVRVTDAQAQPTDADMPPLESLGEGSDYRGFMSPQVSASLRRAALRKLFQSPRFNVRDGLDDYDGDYTRYTPLDDDSLTAHAKFHAARLRERLRSDDGVDEADTADAQRPTHDPAGEGGSEESNLAGAGPGAGQGDKTA